MTHDQLQSKCHIWLWNSHPELRQLFNCSFNDIKLVEKILGPLPSRVRTIILSKMKAIGMVKGILDYQFYYKGVLHVFDFKVGKDRLSKDQELTISRVEANGGKGYEVRSLDEFKGMLQNILQG